MSDSPVSCFTVPGFPRAVGGVSVDNPVWLAPLAGITSCSLRLFFRRLGAGLVHTEMVSALGLCHGGRKTLELLAGTDEERPVVLQLFGSKADDIARGAETALGFRKFEAVEVNMGCPMPKVTKKGSGARLIENPKEASEIVKKLLPLKLPVWVKTRITPQGSAMTTCDFCDILLESGADLVLLHGRTAAQRYEGTASKDAVGEAAMRFPGSICASGDCYTSDDFMDYMRLGCAAVLAGRGVLKDVFITVKALCALGANVPARYSDPDAKLQAELLLELVRNTYNTEGQQQALMIARRMLAALFKGFPGAVQLRRTGAGARTFAEMEDLLLNWEKISSEPALAYNKDDFPHGVAGEF